MDNVAVYGLHGGGGDGADILFSFNDNMISVSIYPSNGTSTESTQHLGPDRPLQDHLVDVISEATTSEDGNKYEKLVDEVLGVILEAGQPLFSSLISTTQQNQTLHELIFPEAYFYLLQAPARYASIVPIDPDEANSILTSDPIQDHNWNEELKIRKELPYFTPDEITVNQVLVRSASSATAAVRVQGRDMFCKVNACPGGIYNTEEGREIEYLGEISKAFPSPEVIQVPQLLGYIHHKKTKKILGFLQEWVPGSRLSNIDIAKRNKQKWISQISQTLECLHEHGLVWGNGKPSNVLIDLKDDIWLIGCGSSFMYEVNEGQVEINQRDKKALTKIVRFLDGGKDVALSD